MTVHEYDFPVWGTQGGGLVRWINGAYYFVEAPKEFPNMTVGSRMPEEWSVVPANAAARRAMDDVEEFDRGVEELIGMMVRRGMSHAEVKEFFGPMGSGEHVAMAPMQSEDAEGPPKPAVKRVRRVGGNLQTTNTR